MNTEWATKTKIASNERKYDMSIERTIPVAAMVTIVDFFRTVGTISKSHLNFAHVAHNSGQLKSNANHVFGTKCTLNENNSLSKTLW